MAESKLAPMSQFPQAARELMRMCGLGIYSVAEVRDITAQKFGFDLMPNEEYFKSEVNVDFQPTVQATVEAADLADEEYADEYPAT